jgi:predicted nuclease with RNAse H fold
VDLAASVRGVSAVAWGVNPGQVQVREVRTDAELLEVLGEVVEIWVDAPLTRGEGPFRTCDRGLHRCGLSVMPLTWPAMQKLSQRAQTLRSQAPQLPWYETFPWAVYKSWGLPKKDLPRIQKALQERGFIIDRLSMHACDAIAAWWMGWLKRHKGIHAFTGPDGTLWVPQSLLPS